MSTADSYRRAALVLRRRLHFLFVAVLAALVTLPTAADAQLDAALKAHGGMSTWERFGAVEYDAVWNLGKGPPLRDHQLIDLHSRRILITSDDYKIGFDGQEAWVSPNLKAFRMPARFYVSTPFYFFGMPFVFADPGAIVTSLGKKRLGDKEYDVFKVAYGPGVGDTPEDDYVVYCDPLSHRMHLVHYTVTYLPFRGGKPVKELDRHALVFDTWQQAHGLLVMKRGSFFEWQDDKLVGEAQGTLEFSNVRFRRVSPMPKLFAKPENAEIDHSLKR